MPDMKGSPQIIPSEQHLKELQMDRQPTPEERVEAAEKALTENPLLPFKMMLVEMQRLQSHLNRIEGQYHQLRQTLHQHGHLDGRVVIHAAAAEGQNTMGIGASQLRDIVPDWVRVVESMPK